MKLPPWPDKKSAPLPEGEQRMTERDMLRMILDRIGEIEIRMEARFSVIEERLRQLDIKLSLVQSFLRDFRDEQHDWRKEDKK
jgi:hypothetical protein